MTVVEKIKDVMDRYYIKKEIKSKDHLIEILNIELTVNQFNEAIEHSMLTNDYKLVNYVLYTGFLMKYFNAENEPTLRKILLLNFHKSHEDIVSLFQLNYNNTKENIPSLLNAIKIIPDYLSPSDFKYPYIRKIIYAIGAQPEPDNVQALEILSQSDDEEIKKIALHQIEKRKKLGRWEAEENE
ncbi:hypothetical protein CFS9_31490 [Flavobacterium sp. CFS9]|uniref:HEAT repeat domain-containing protein n=1 Tax=Flavobacterium sp. CFS9 TaxID=3143118 RepID=A0AAT9H4T6_9FLAO